MKLELVRMPVADADRAIEMQLRQASCLPVPGFPPHME